MIMIFISCELKQKIPPPIVHQDYVRFGGQPILQYALFVNYIDDANPDYGIVSTRIAVTNISSYHIDSCAFVIYAYTESETILENNISRIVINTGSLSAGDSISFDLINTNNIWSQTSPTFEQEFVQIDFTLGNTYNQRNGIYSGKYATLHDTTINNIKNALSLITADDRFIAKFSGTQEIKTIVGDIYMNNFLCVAKKKDGTEVTSLTQDSMYFNNDTLFIKFLPSLTNNADSADVIEINVVKTNEI